MKKRGDKGKQSSAERIQRGEGFPNSGWLLSPCIIHQSSVLRAGSFCVWYICSGTAAHDWATNVRTWTCLLINTARSSFLLPYSRGWRKVGFLILLVHMRECTHTHGRQKTNSTQVIRNLDIHSWNCFSLLSIISAIRRLFPSPLCRYSDLVSFLVWSWS